MSSTGAARGRAGRAGVDQGGGFEAVFLDPVGKRCSSGGRMPP
ncbi:hypothetical protein AB0B95_33445 [Streptomyces hygroscopicus]|nr:hypothetical protein [Streptomyces hygroscopicus]